jgi:ABC-type antimicrobial peptide transport system ATPase subunit
MFMTFSSEKPLVNILIQAVALFPEYVPADEPTLTTSQKSKAPAAAAALIRAPIWVGDICVPTQGTVPKGTLLTKID